MTGIRKLQPSFALGAASAGGNAVRGRFTAQRWFFVPFIVSVAIIVYLFLGLLKGQALDEDYAVYLKEASNIAEGVSLKDMGVDYYVDPNLSLTMQGPLTYPPLLPALYALPVKIFGYDIAAFKTFNLFLLFLGLTIFSYAMPRWGFSVLETATSLIVFALAPEIHNSSNGVDSDLPFLFFLILAMLAVGKATRATPETRWLWGIVMGVAIFVATETRIVALVLLPTAWLVGLIRYRRVAGWEFITAAASFAILWGAEYLLIDRGPGYGVVSNYEFFTPFTNLRQFYWAMAHWWDSAPFPMGVVVLLLGLVALALVGIIYEAAQGTTAALFLICYTALLLVLPDFEAGARYLIPHILFFGAFICRGANVTARMFSNRFEAASKAIGPITAAVTVLFFASSDPAYPAGLRNIGIAMPPVQEVFSYIRTNVPEDARIAVSKYRSFYLFTARHTIRPLSTHAPAELADWLRKNDVAYVVLKYSPSTPALRYSDCPASALCNGSQQPPGLEEVWRNSDFVLLRVAQTPAL